MPPQYFFDIHDGTSQLHDVQGSDLSNDREAEIEVISILHDMARSVLVDDDGDLLASVRNAAGHVIFKAKLALILERIQPSAAAEVE